MNISPDKENILKAIRKALTQSTPLPFSKSEGNSSVFHPLQQEPEIEFAERFTSLMGKFVYCMNKEDLAVQLRALIVQQNWSKVYCPDPVLQQQLAGVQFTPTGIQELRNCDVAITGCECLIARTGTVVLSAAIAGGRTVSVYAPVHICVAYTSQLVPDIRDGLVLLQEKYGPEIPSMISFATGPSRTADIEKTLVVGVHGPGETYVFLIDDRDNPDH